MFKPVYTLTIERLREVVPTQLANNFISNMGTHHVGDVAFWEQCVKVGMCDDWIWSEVSDHPRIVPLLERCLDQVDWISLAKNPNAVHLLEERAEKEKKGTSFWMNLSKNPNAIHLLERYPDKICWLTVTTNPNALHLVEQHFANSELRAHLFANGKTRDTIWRNLASNSNSEAMLILERYMKEDLHNAGSTLCANPHAIPFIERYLDTGFVNWFNLSQNPNAVHLLEQHPDKVVWSSLFRNPNPRAFALLERHLKETWDTPWEQIMNHTSILHVHSCALSSNPHAIHILERCSQHLCSWCWYELARNPNAVNILKNNLHKLDRLGWNYLCQNPNVDQILGNVLDKDIMRANCQPFACELAEKVFHPTRLMHICEVYGNGMDLADYMELIDS